MGRWGFTREGECRRGRRQGEGHRKGGRNSGSGEVNRCLPGTAVSAEGVAKHMCGHWTPVPSSASGTWFAEISPDLSDLLHFPEGILFRRLCVLSHELTPSFSSSELMLPCQPLPAGIQAEMGRPDLSAAS